MQLKPTVRETAAASKPVGPPESPRRPTKTEKRRMKALRKRGRKEVNTRNQEPKALILRDGKTFVVLKTGQQLACDVFHERGGDSVVTWPGMPSGKRFVVNRTHKNQARTALRPGP